MGAWHVGIEIHGVETSFGSCLAKLLSRSFVGLQAVALVEAEAICMGQGPLLATKPLL